jgi:hypothetical protein
MHHSSKISWRAISDGRPALMVGSWFRDRHSVGAVDVAAAGAPLTTSAAKRTGGHGPVPVTTVKAVYRAALLHLRDHQETTGRSAGDGTLGFMKRLLRRLLPFSLADRPLTAVVCYMRENGPIAYAIDRFSSAPREAAEAMLDTALRWHWRSGARGWTELTRISLSAFLADLQADELLIVGLEADTGEEVSD